MATPVLQSLLRSARNQNNDEDHPDWDSDMASFLLLLHILPPQPTKKKTQNGHGPHSCVSQGALKNT
ncbi:uncharacterized protein LOC108897147 isoform X1 [Lates japonicus]